jgi:hypothetical protein
MSRELTNISIEQLDKEISRRETMLKDSARKRPQSQSSLSRSPDYNPISKNHSGQIDIKKLHKSN